MIEQIKTLILELSQCDPQYVVKIITDLENTPIENITIEKNKDGRINLLFSTHVEEIIKYHVENIFCHCCLSINSNGFYCCRVNYNS